MRKKLVLVSFVFIFLFVSANLVSAVHPLIGTWKCRYVFGGKTYTDYIKITSVSTSGKVEGKDQYNNFVGGHTKNNMVLLTHAVANTTLTSYYWGYNGVVFARFGVVFQYQQYLVAQWPAMYTPTKVAAIPSDLPDCDSVEWSIFQSALIEMLQDRQK